ncbi:MAG TPA: DUF1249 domain-containing protein [Gammaproteobacteria bacterium]|nr:DUF1249 domain-containing protein [Gammaproteobacteria bacterium]
MLVDSLIVPQCVYRPGTFTGLMSLYESNYIKLRQLGTELEWSADAVVSAPIRDHALHAEILRREPYTTTLRLTYWLSEDGGAVVPEPDLVLRIYHDARLVEAVSCAESLRHAKLRELARDSHTELGRRWQLNMLLNKWLDYLFEVGHSLEGLSSRSVNRAERPGSSI